MKHCHFGCVKYVLGVYVLLLSQFGFSQLPPTILEQSPGQIDNSAAQTPSSSAQGKAQALRPQYAPYGNGLSILVSSGLATNPVVRSKSQLADVAKFGIDTAKWQFFPTPTASVQQARTAENDPSYQGSNRVMQLGLQQPIWTGGRLVAGLSLAEKKLVVAQLDLEETKEQIALRIVSAFSSWNSSRAKLKAYEDNVNTLNNLQSLIKRRVEAGLAPESDFIFSSGRLDQALADLETSKAQLKNSLTSLTQLVGSEVISEELSPINQPMLRYGINSDEMLSNALLQRPSILKAKAQIDIQDSQIDLAKSSVSPSLSLTFQRQNGDFSYTNVTTNTQNRVFLSLSTSFGAGLSNYSQISSAIAQRDSAISDEEFAKRNVTEEILNDISLMKSSEFRVKSTALACDAASSTAQSWQRQFLVGKKAWQDLLNSTRELAVCRASLAEAKEFLLVLNWRLAVYSMGLERTLNLTPMK